MVCCREKGLKIINSNPNNAQSAEGGVAAVLQDDIDDAVDPHLERIKYNQAAGDESDEEERYKKRLVREVFHRIVRSRTEGIDSIGRAE